MENILQYNMISSRHIGIIKPYSVRAFIGSIEAGEALELTLQIDSIGTITDAKYRMFGCLAASLSAEAMIDLIIGKKVDEARSVSKQHIIEFIQRKHGVTLHCCVLGDAALKQALECISGTVPECDDPEILCTCLNIRRRDIENLILDNELLTAGRIIEQTGAGSCCGKCQSRIYSILSKIMLQNRFNSQTRRTSIV